MSDTDEYVESSLAGFQEVEESTEVAVEKDKWIMKKLNPMHLQVCALLAQGMKQVDVAKICEITPVYVSMLFRQPLIQQEIARISAAAQVRLEASYSLGVDTVIDMMKTGGPQDKLRAVRLMGELTKRIGKPDPLARSNEVNDERLADMARRLESLAQGARRGPETIIDAEFVVRSSEGQ